MGVNPALSSGRPTVSLSSTTSSSSLLALGRSSGVQRPPRPPLHRSAHRSPTVPLLWKSSLCSFASYSRIANSCYPRSPLFLSRCFSSAFTLSRTVTTNSDFSGISLLIGSVPYRIQLRLSTATIKLSSPQRVNNEASAPAAHSPSVNYESFPVSYISSPQVIRV